MHNFEVSREESGLKLLDFLKRRLGEAYSNREIKKLLDAKLCLVNGQVERFASRPVAVGDLIRFEEQLLRHEILKAVFDSEGILYEDPYYLIYNKPSSVASDSTGLLKLLKNYNAHLFLTHRLDKETTGAIILAKTKEAEEKMIDAFRKREVQKEYLAIVEGIPSHAKGEIRNYLGKIQQWQGQTLYGEVSKERGSLAITSWECLKKGDSGALIVCHPKTGRTHQLRVHLSELGHPIQGDVQYGRKSKKAIHAGRILLHAQKIHFVHPITAEVLEINAPLPPDFEEALKKL